MPATIVAGILLWSAAAYYAYLEQSNRLQETLRQRLEVRAAVAAERIEAVAGAVENAANNSITIAAMAGQDVERVVKPYLQSISFADATAQRVALVDYRARLIMADRDVSWQPPPDWDAAFDRVSDGSFESLLDGDRLVLVAPVVLGSFVEGALVADISLGSLFTDLDATGTNPVVVPSELETPLYHLWSDGTVWLGDVTWPLNKVEDVAIQMRNSVGDAGFWDNPLQFSIATVFSLLIALTATAITMAADSVAAPVRRLVDELSRRGLNVRVPSKDAPAEIWTLTHRFLTAAEDVEQALVRERELTAQQSQFVTMVSHEFRTPLAIIDGATGALKRRRARMDDEAIAGKLQTISTAVTRLLRLMESTLNAARLDSDGFTIERAPVDLQLMARTLATERQSLTSDLHLEFDLDRLPKVVLADERLLTSVVDNLLSNATKYGGKPPRIRIEGWADTTHANLAFSDNGVGIPQDQIDRIGERFFRASTSTGISGTGVGLNMVKLVLQEHGGALLIDSELGVGSTFTVRLPLTTADGPAQITETPPLPPLDGGAEVWRLIYTIEVHPGAQDDDLQSLWPRNANFPNLPATSSDTPCSEVVTGTLAVSKSGSAHALEGAHDTLHAVVQKLAQEPAERRFKFVSFDRVPTRAYLKAHTRRLPATSKMSPLAYLQQDITIRSGQRRI